MAIGSGAGGDTQSSFGIALGFNAASSTQQSNGIAIGSNAAGNNQGTGAIAIGQNAGGVNQAVGAISIGRYAGSNQTASSIILYANPTGTIGSALNDGGNDGLFIKPIRATGAITNSIGYDTSSGEVFYQPAKTFVISHPSNEKKFLVHACLEGPESGVYYRGHAEIPEGETEVQVNFPDYVPHFAKDFTVSITPIYNGAYRHVNSSKPTPSGFKAYGPPGEFSWIAYGVRNYIKVEVDKDDVVLNGDGPYTWISEK